MSAFDDFAVDAFELAALDYLVKPVSRQRLDEAIERVARAVAPPGAPRPRPQEDDVLPVDAPRGGGTRLLARSSILFLQAHGDYVRVAADEGRFLLRARLGRPRGALGARTASCACTAASSSTCGARSRCARGSTARPCW